MYGLPIPIHYVTWYFIFQNELRNSWFIRLCDPSNAQLFFLTESSESYGTSICFLDPNYKTENLLPSDPLFGFNIWPNYVISCFRFILYIVNCSLFVEVYANGSYKNQDGQDWRRTKWIINVSRDFLADFFWVVIGSWICERVYAWQWNIKGREMIAFNNHIMMRRYLSYTHIVMYLYRM